MKLSFGVIVLLVVIWLVVGVVVNLLLMARPRGFSLKRLLTTPWWTEEDFYLRAVFYCAPIWPIMLLAAWFGAGLRRSVEEASGDDPERRGGDD